MNLISAIGRLRRAYKGRGRTTSQPTESRPGGLCGGATRATRATGLVRVRVRAPRRPGPLDGRREFQPRRRSPRFDFPEAGGFQ